MRPDRVPDEILRRYSARCQPLQGVTFLAGAGGLSGARLWRFRSQQGLLVLRAWPEDGPRRDHLEGVHCWLALAQHLGFIPVPIPDSAGLTLHDHGGRLWELTPWMPGTPEHGQPPRAERVAAAFGGLAAFHRCLACEQRDGYSPGLQERASLTSRLIRHGFDTLERAIIAARRHRPDDPLRDAATRWIALARPIAPLQLERLQASAARVVRLQPCLRDARPEHFLFEGDRLSGLVDFGAMDVECVASDLARLSGQWLQGDFRSLGMALASYKEIQPLAADEALLIDAFESSAALLIGERWVRWHYIEGRRFDDPHAVAAGLARAVALVERVAARTSPETGVIHTL
jgi:homoserine kinase type II